MCFQKNVQNKILSSSNYDISHLMHECDTKIKTRTQIEQNIQDMLTKINDILNEEKLIKSEIMLKNKEIKERDAELDEKIEFFRNSFQTFCEASPKMVERVRQKKSQMTRSNEILFQINEESRQLDDKIIEYTEYLNQTKHENELINKVINFAFKTNYQGDSIDETNADIDPKFYETILNDTNENLIQQIQQLKKKKLEKEHKLDCIKRKHHELSRSTSLDSTNYKTITQ
jgi:hypothetical protein